MVGFQSLQLVLKSQLDLLQVSGALVLAVLPNGAQVGLENEPGPPPLQGPSQVGTKFGIRRIQIDAVDAAGLHPVHKSFHGFIWLMDQSLAAHPDFTDGKAGSAQGPVFHCGSLPS